MRALGFLLPLAGLAMSAPAQAQINPFGDADKTKLSSSDFRVLDETTRRLLARPDLAPGIRENWTNPETKSTGSLTVKNRLHRRGLDCMAVGYRSMARGKPPNRIGALNWCKTPQGWKIG